MLISSEKIKYIFEKTVKKYDNFAIIPHYNPDPDALGSSFAMQFLLNKVFNKKSTIYFSGIIGRAENIRMKEILDIPLANLKEEKINIELPIMLMDTQPNTGNNPVTHRKNIKFVFDHHQLIEASKKIKYADIRENFGSTSSIIFSYFKEFGLKPSVNVATALYYGIQTDVVGEGRTAFKIDFDYMEDLSSLISREKLYSIENPKLPFTYYVNVNKGMENSVIYNDFLITTLGKIDNPDYIGEIADFLIRFDKCNILLVMGVHENFIQLSFRSQKKSVHAGNTLRKIIGRKGTAGGHASSAGGKIVFNNSSDIPKLNKAIITTALKLLQQDKITSGIPLLSLSDYLDF